MDKRTRHSGVVLALLIWAWIAVTDGWTGVPTGVKAQGPSAAASTPHSVLYQGYVTLSDEPYSGVGYFKFAVVNEGASAVYWSNDGTLGVPTVPVPIEVLDGYFTVLLGDTSLSGMRQELDPRVFQAPGRYLKVWFSKTQFGRDTALDPVSIAAAPYALNAETLDGLDANALASTAAYAGENQTEGLSPTDEILRYVDITALRSGWIIVNASLYTYHPADGQYTRCSITTGAVLDTSAFSVASNAGYASLSMTRGYTVGAGTHRFNLVCDAASDQVTARDSNINAIYVPGSFAALSAPDASPAAAPIPEGCVDVNGDQCGP